ncbi:MAG: aldo/keto reductase [Ectothiorhodospiraceae bacterium]|nr:aldo/keto reductase [Ectothiorhodospiraceae bacterium]
MASLPPTVQLGTGDLKISRMGFGCMGMSEFYGDSEDENSINTLHAALERGVNFFDTADMYGNGHNEKLIGEAFADRWDRVVLATKFGVVRGENGEFHGISGKPEYVKEACERSLQRLGVECIDLYYAHRLDSSVPVEETVGAMKALVDEGKVRYLGLSEANADQIRRAHEVHPIAALQTEYSLWSREVEGEILDTCRELGITFVSYSPLGRGFLTGKYMNPEDLDENDFRRNNPRFKESAIEENKQFVKLVEDMAAQKGATPAQIALAWVLNQGKYIVPIPGTRKIHRLDENLKALEIELKEDDLQTIREKLPQETAGARY